MESKLNFFNNWLEEEIAACTKQQQLLAADNRGDEAVFEKIKINVYDIFHTILSVGVKTQNGNPDAVKRFFLTKADEIPANWADSYQKAKEHGDTEKMQIERIKLDTIEQIKTKFLAVWEETK